MIPVLRDAVVEPFPFSKLDEEFSPVIFILPLVYCNIISLVFAEGERKEREREEKQKQMQEEEGEEGEHTWKESSFVYSDIWEQMRQRFDKIPSVVLQNRLGLVQEINKKERKKERK